MPKLHLSRQTDLTITSGATLAISGIADINTLKIDGTAVTASASEINLLDGSLSGTIVNSKGVIYGAAGQVNATTLQLGGTSITATAAEINQLDDNAFVSNITVGSSGTPKNLTVFGDLTVSGQSIQSDPVVYKDPILQLNYSSLSVALAAADGGLDVGRSGSPPAVIRWNATTDKWVFGIAGASKNIASDDITITAGSGLAGGGSISSNRILDIGSGTGITVGADSISTDDSAIAHDSLSGFVANEHIDHSTVSIIAGSGLVGGGTITQSRTLHVGDGTYTTISADSIDVDTTALYANLDDQALTWTALQRFDGGGSVATGKVMTLTDAPSAATDAVNKAYVDGTFAPSDANKGSSAPGTAVSGMLWYDTSTANRYLKIYNGSAWETLNTVAASASIADAGNIITATTVEGALAENRAAIDTAEASITNLNHDTLTGFVAGEHTDWSGSGAGTIHSTNYTNTTYDIMGSGNSYQPGLVLTGSGIHSNNFLRKDGTWQVVADPEVMGSANSYAAGLVLAGHATHGSNFLRKDGTWQTITVPDEITISSSDPSSSSDFSATEVILNNTNGRLFWLKSDNSAIYYSDYDNTVDLTLSIASFSDAVSGTTHLVGSGDWKAIGAITFAVTYNNGPPSSAVVKETVASPDLQVASNTGNSFTNTTAVPYPSRDGTARFRVTADTLNYDEATTHTFYNNIKWGVSTEASGWDSADIVGLAGTELSNDQTRSESITGVGAGDYVMFAFPSGYTSLHSTGIKYNGVTAGFESPATVSVTNAKGYTENYKVYRSTLTGIGSYTLETSTSDTIKNYIYYGESSDTSLTTEAEIEGLEDNIATTDHTRTFSFDGVSAEYLYVSVPSRFSDYHAEGWTYNGELMAMTKQGGTISVTNAVGYAETYETYRSDLAVSGNFNLVTYTSSRKGNGTLNIYLGRGDQNSSFSEADIEALASAGGGSTSTLSNDATQAWGAITMDASNQYWVLAVPTNLSGAGTLSFTDSNTGFGFAMEDVQTVAGITNQWGFSQDYYVYASTNALGNGSVISVTSS